MLTNITQLQVNKEPKSLSSVLYKTKASSYMTYITFEKQVKLTLSMTLLVFFLSTNSQS